MAIPIKPDPSAHTQQAMMEIKVPESKSLKNKNSIPNELTKQNISKVEAEKNLKDSNIEYKAHPDPEDMKTVTIAAERFEFDPIPEGEENMTISNNVAEDTQIESELDEVKTNDDEGLTKDRIDDEVTFIAEDQEFISESLTIELSTDAEVEEFDETSEDGDLLDDMMNEEASIVSEDTEVETGTVSKDPILKERSESRDVIEKLMEREKQMSIKYALYHPSNSRETTAEDSSQILNNFTNILFEKINNYIKYTDNQLNNFIKSNFVDPSKNIKITNDGSNIKECAFIHIKEENKIFIRHKPSEEHFHSFHEFVKKLNLEPHEVQQLEIIHLDESQWEKTTVAIDSFLVLQRNYKQTIQNQSSKMKKAESGPANDSNRPATFRRSNQVKKQAISKQSKAGFNESLEMQKMWNEEKTLQDLRTKERDRQAKEKEHRIIEKEIEKTELKHETIKRDRKNP